MKENLKFEFLVSFLFRKDFKKDRKLPPAYTGRGCRVCNTPQSESMIWYHLKTIVQDETSSTTFIIFGTKGEKLLGISVNNLIASVAVDPKVLHPVMERFCEKRVKNFFHMTVKHNEYEEDALEDNLFVGKGKATSVKLILSSGLNHEEVGSITSLKGKEILREFEELNEKHSVPPIVLGVDQVKSVVLEMVMQSRKGLQLDDLHENNNKEFSNQSSEIYNASITNDYQEKMERENEK
ncbi:hypothetical protein SLEP1_g58742 [Rubroshorea leprosula]|uniref:Replication factor A C-terminal domain-containing protein n=1 Tax=Rubroshorea leprosula TaxID=152421 RepID=A0AAV5MQE8_9ROSI|nr:hypothetical protein SLEP1_g58742 [Rubroshorea leprosula]